MQLISVLEVCLLSGVSYQSTFTALPAEQRQIIYEELSGFTGSLICYMVGRHPYFNIETTILRVNRQGYTESAWVLYGRNADFSSSASTSPRCRAYPVIRPNPIHQPPSYGSSRNERRGMIFSFCLRRMRQIILVFSG